MIKQITTRDIKESYMSYNQYEIIHAESDAKNIYVYFNDFQRIIVHCTSKNVYEAKIQQIMDKNKIKQVNKKTLSLNELFLTFIFLAVLFYYFLTPFHLYGFLTFNHLCILAVLLSSILMILLEFRSTYKYLKKFKSFNERSNHSAEHMICNFIAKHHRLPENLTELKHSSRLDESCNTSKYLDHDTINFAINTFIIFIFSFGLGNILMQKNLPLFYIWGICIVLFIIISSICYYANISISPICSILTLLFNYLLQFFVTTTRKVTDRSLITAYIAGSIWFRVIFPKEFSIDSYQAFLKKYDITVKDKTEQS